MIGVNFKAGVAASETFKDNKRAGDAAFLLQKPDRGIQDGYAISVVTPGQLVPSRQPFKAMVYSGKMTDFGPFGIEPGVNKIAVLRSNAIGDFVFALPALNALRAAYPQAEIVLLGLEWHANFLKGRPGPVDRVVVVPRSRGVSGHEDEIDDIEAQKQFFQEMAQEKFDLSIQMHGGGRFSNPFVRRLGARLSIGLRSPDAIPLDRWIPYFYWQHEVLRFLEVVALVGARPVGLEPSMAVIERDYVEASAHVPHGEDPLYVFHIGAGDSRRRWPVEKFAAVGNALGVNGGRVVLVGTEREQDLVDRLQTLMAVEVINVCGKISLGGLAALLSRAAVVISNDSGPLHIAEAVGAPTVGIFWAGNLVNAGPITRTRHRPAISWRMNCPVCGLDTTRSQCGHQESFVADISQEEVIASALELAQLYGMGARAEQRIYL